ncbi:MULTISPECIES: helix-turn-helix transcriptional regulator [unclassified Microbacterium]|uniref:helix-turn-helix transcriptional regulator n=1 Tax=unclassified Microbacterium TaxID=2609290 RepID=UPI003018276E
MTTITLNGTLTLGRLLSLYRQTAGIDQTQMGALVGASRATISAWETDGREPSFSQVVAWARITGQPLDALVEAATVHGSEG